MLFVHGLWMNGVETWWLRHRVGAQGYDTHAFSYPTLHAAPEQVVEQLAQSIAGLPPPVHLVGHSLGGLMLLKLFELRPGQPPGRVVLLGSPVAGSHAARSVAGWAIGPSLLGRIALQEIVQYRPRRWDQPRDLGIIAGSTSAGGGAVAFPVMTLMFEISPECARNFSLAIQSVGMTAAAFAIWRCR